MKFISNNPRFFTKLEKLENLERFIWNRKVNSRKVEQKCGIFYTTLRFMIDPQEFLKDDIGQR